ncbi:MAG: response regulator, partial [Akkermansiaceae bacterium]|nr:response regulator [Armatimonadota bacterium]
ALTMLRDALHRGGGYDLAVVDFRMPGMNGFDLAAIIHSDAALSSLPMVMLTPYGQRGGKGRAGDLGILASLTKPVRQTRLAATLVAVLSPGGDASLVPGGRAGPGDTRPLPDSMCGAAADAISPWRPRLS